MDARTTRTDSVADGGAMELGVHYAAVGSLSILRASTPTPLALHANVPSLPFLDASGVLSDPALPLLFYSVEIVENEIPLRKNLAQDTVRIDF
jgi:hypothetical protein